MPKETLAKRYRRYEGNWKIDAGKLGKRFDDKKHINNKLKKRSIGMGALKGIIGFLGLPLVKFLSGLMIDNMSESQLRHTSANKRGDGDMTMGINSSEFNRDAIKTPRVWDNWISSVALHANKKLYKRHLLNGIKPNK